MSTSAPSVKNGSPLKLIACPRTADEAAICPPRIACEVVERSWLDDVEPDLEFVQQLQQLGQRLDVGLDLDLPLFGLGEQRRLFQQHPGERRAGQRGRRVGTRGGALG